MHCCTVHGTKNLLKFYSLQQEPQSFSSNVRRIWIHVINCTETLPSLKQQQQNKTKQKQNQKRKTTTTTENKTKQDKTKQKQNKTKQKQNSDFSRFGSVWSRFYQLFGLGVFCCVLFMKRN